MENKLSIPGSVLSFSSNVNYFDLPPTDLTSVSSEVTQYFPLAPYRDNENPIQFLILGSPTHYLDLHSARLYLKVRILNTDATNITTADAVGPTFNFFPALFQSC